MDAQIQVEKNTLKMDYVYAWGYVRVCVHTISAIRINHNNWMANLEHLINS